MNDLRYVFAVTASRPDVAALAAWHGTFVCREYHVRMTVRQRLSATVQADLLAAGRNAVAEGRAESLSGWVNEALARQTDHERRMKALDEFIRAYEAEHGEISAAEIRDARRRARARAVVIRPPAGEQRRSSPRRRRGAA